MEAMLGYLRAVPPFELILSFAGAAAMVSVLLTIITSRRFETRVRTLVELDRSLSGLFSDIALIRHSRCIEKLARIHGHRIVEESGAGRVWLRRLGRYRSAAAMRRVMEFLPDEGLFTCFIASLARPSLARQLAAWISENGDSHAVRRIAASGAGLDFDGKSALEMLKPLLPQIRELAADPEWPVRFFAVKILLHDRDRRSARVLEGAFADPYPLVRATAARSYVPESGDFLYPGLAALLLDDPSFEVRREARSRIARDFPERFSVPSGELNTIRGIHLLELLDRGSKEDENIALHFLEQDNLELTLPAALFLASVGSLRRLFLSADIGDRKSFDRTLLLLEHACAVNVSDFLRSVGRVESIGPLILAARLMARFGPRGDITALARRVFTMGKTDRSGPGYSELYQHTLEAVSKRGNEGAWRLLRGELDKRKDPEFLGFLLASIPSAGDTLFTPRLLSFFLDPSFPCREALRGCLRRMEPSLVLPTLFDVLKGARGEYPRTIRADALRLMGEYRLDYCIQWLLENLPVLDPEEAREFAALINSFAGTAPAERIDGIMASIDSRLRAAALSALPSTGDKRYVKTARQALGDAAPEVRIAAMQALLYFEESRAVQTCESLLRDPVEKVRLAAAGALAASSTSGTLERFGEILADTGESPAVKRAAIEGLGKAGDIGAVDILANAVSGPAPVEPGLTRDIVRSLGRKTARPEMKRLVGLFREGPPVLRRAITDAFKIMGHNAEEDLVRLLREEVQSLMPFLSEILEESGYIEAAIRKLSHRDPEIRRDAATILSLIRTPASYRGLVLAVKDPDQEVRVMVTKALERLNTKAGRIVLDRLREDPDERVRRYTLWALERIEAKKSAG